MGLQNDLWIIKQAEKGMITPFANNGIIKMNDIISFGVSSYGYDMRVAGEFKIFTNQWPGIVDPKHFDQHLQFHDEIIKTDVFHGETDYSKLTDNAVIIPPNSFALARSVEYFKMPRNVFTICIGKSTLARCGIIVNVTAFEPEWEGYVTIEISNTTPLPAKVYAFEGIAQVIFFEADEECAISYKDKRGKYQGQTGITTPVV